MKDEIDLIALDLFHHDPEFAELQDEFLKRDIVANNATRKSQALSLTAKELLERKADDIGVSRDRVLQQAILFRAAVVRYTETEGDSLERARADVEAVVDEASRTAARIDTLLGEGHWLSVEFNRLCRSLSVLAGNPSAIKGQD